VLASPAPFSTPEGEFSISIESGKEWHSNAIPLGAGDALTVTVLGNDKFYAGLFSREIYIKYRGAGVGRTFGFDFGSDALSWTDQIRAKEADDYYFVLRVGAFTPGTTKLKIRWRFSPG
jgi:hypothetical protein